MDFLNLLNNQQSQLPPLAGQLGTDQFGSQLNLPQGGSQLGGQQLAQPQAPKPDPLKEIIDRNFLIIGKRMMTKFLKDRVNVVENVFPEQLHKELNQVYNYVRGR